jgi:hypothetical protein
MENDLNSYEGKVDFLSNDPDELACAKKEWDIFWQSLIAGTVHDNYNFHNDAHGRILIIPRNGDLMTFVVDKRPDENMVDFFEAQRQEAIRDLD